MSKEINNQPSYIYNILPFKVYKAVIIISKLNAEDKRLQPPLWKKQVFYDIIEIVDCIKS